MIIYDGPSRLDGAPIVAVLTRGTKNSKTGPMVQSWILLRDTPPQEATRTGADASICGQCPHRPAARGTCYVNAWQAPLAVWRKYQRNGYPTVPRTRTHFAAVGEHVRIGAYGDPAAVPVEVWRDLLKTAVGHSGYTHQWRSAPGLRPYIMASTDTPGETAEARARGWRTFRVRRPGDPLLHGEISCPAADESGKRTTCARCLLCAGARTHAPNISVHVHGSRAVAF